jgi:hypothetical protein
MASMSRQTTKISLQQHITLHLGTALSERALIHVAQRHDPRIVVLQKGIHQLAAAIGYSQKSQPDSLVGAQQTGGAGRCRGCGEPQRDRGPSIERPPSDLLAHRTLLR